MRKEESTFLSNDGIHNIHCVKWSPDEGIEVNAILQITHGMVEFIERYEPFANFLTEKGFIVVGHDHLGHGKSVNDSSEWGFFAENNALMTVVDDIKKVTDLTKDAYPDKPFFILGHSMGSYLLRTYLTCYSNGLDGAIIMGTGTEPKVATSFGRCLAKFVAKIKGSHYRSDQVAALSQGPAYKMFDCTGKDSSNSWLTKDSKIVEWYYNEPACTYLFTVNGYHTLFSAVECACDIKKMQNINKKLPLFIVSGACDPVGNHGKGVVKAYEAYKASGIEDVSMKLYENDRHEILNELDKEVVMNDIYDWMTKRIKN